VCRRTLGVSSLRLGCGARDGLAIGHWDLWIELLGIWIFVLLCFTLALLLRGLCCLFLGTSDNGTFAQEVLSALSQTTAILKLMISIWDHKCSNIGFDREYQNSTRKM
jgi:hypothetical protein